MGARPTGLLEFTLCAHVRTQEGGGASPGPLCGKRRETESGVTGTEKEGRKEREKGEREREGWNLPLFVGSRGDSDSDSDSDNTN